MQTVVAPKIGFNLNYTFNKVMQGNIRSLMTGQVDLTLLG